MPNDRVVPLVLGAGAVGLVGLGLYFWLKKPPGISPGDTIVAQFNFNYHRIGGDYILLTRFGWYKPWYLPLGFDEEETLGHHILAISLTKPDSYKYNYNITIPDAARPGTYDVEGAILRPGMEPGKDWIIRAYQKEVINVRE